MGEAVKDRPAAGGTAAAVGMVVAAMALIPLGASLAKSLFPALGPSGTAAMRLAIAAVVLCLVWRPDPRVLTRAGGRSVLVYGLSLGGMNLLIYAALTRIPLGVAIALEFIGPLSIALLGSRRPADFVWVALAVAGILLLTPLAGASAGLDPVGVGFALAAGACWFAYILAGRRAGAAVHGGTATALGMAIGALVALPFGLANAADASLTWGVLPTAVGVAFLSSVVPYSLEMAALPRLPARTFGVLMSLEPAFGALAGLAFLGEQLDAIQWVAIGCVILASAGSASATKPPPEVAA